MKLTFPTYNVPIKIKNIPPIKKLFPVKIVTSSLKDNLLQIGVGIAIATAEKSTKPSPSNLKSKDIVWLYSKFKIIILKIPSVHPKIFWKFNFSSLYIKCDKIIIKKVQSEDMIAAFADVVFEKKKKKNMYWRVVCIIAIKKVSLMVLRVINNIFFLFIQGINKVKIPDSVKQIPAKYICFDISLFCIFKLIF